MQLSTEQATNFWAHFPDGALTPQEVIAVATLPEEGVDFFQSDLRIVRQEDESGRVVDAELATFAGDTMLRAS